MALFGSLGFELFFFVLKLINYVVLELFSKVAGIFMLSQEALRYHIYKLLNFKESESFELKILIEICFVFVQLNFTKSRR